MSLNHFVTSANEHLDAAIAQSMGGNMTASALMQHWSKRKADLLKTDPALVPVPAASRGQTSGSPPSQPDVPEDQPRPQVNRRALESPRPPKRRKQNAQPRQSRPDENISQEDVPVADNNGQASLIQLRQNAKDTPNMMDDLASADQRYRRAINVAGPANGRMANLHSASQDRVMWQVQGPFDRTAYQSIPTLATPSKVSASSFNSTVNAFGPAANIIYPTVTSIPNAYNSSRSPAGDPSHATVPGTYNDDVEEEVHARDHEDSGHQTYFNSQPMLANSASQAPRQAQPEQPIHYHNEVSV